MEARVPDGPKLIFHYTIVKILDSFSGEQFIGTSDSFYKGKIVFHCLKTWVTCFYVHAVMNRCKKTNPSKKQKISMFFTKEKTSSYSCDKFLYLRMPFLIGKLYVTKCFWCGPHFTAMGYMSIKNHNFPQSGICDYSHPII